MVVGIQGLSDTFKAVAMQLLDGLFNIQQWQHAAQLPYPQSADAITHQLFWLLNMLLILITFVIHLSPGM